MQFAEVDNQMVALSTEFADALRRVEEAMRVIHSLTERIRREIGQEQSALPFKSREDLFSRLFPEGLPFDRLKGKPQKDDSTEDKRRDKRVPLVQEVECEGEFGTLRKPLADISAGGMFIQVFNPLPLGTVMKVKFSLPNFAEAMMATTKVVYAQEKMGMGVRFLDLKPEDKKKVQQFVDWLSNKKSFAGEDFVRRSSRVNVSIPVKLRTTGKNGTNSEEQATIITLSKYGACVLANVNSEVGNIVFIRTQKGLEFKASVAWVGNELSKTKGQIGIKCRGLAQALGFNFPE